MEDVPVGVENGCGVAAEQRYLVGCLALLVEGDNSKGAATAGLPVHREVVGVRLGERRVSELNATASGWGGVSASSAYLDEVGVPSIATDVKVVVAELLSRRLAKDVSCWGQPWSASCQWTAARLRDGTRDGRRTGGRRPESSPDSDLRYFDARTKRPAILCTELRLDDVLLSAR